MAIYDETIVRDKIKLLKTKERDVFHHQRILLDLFKTFSALLDIDIPDKNPDGGNKLNESFEVVWTKEKPQDRETNAPISDTRRDEIYTACMTAVDEALAKRV